MLNLTKHMIILISLEKAFGKAQNPFLIKIFPVKIHRWALKPMGESLRKTGCAASRASPELLASWRES